VRKNCGPTNSQCDHAGDRRSGPRDADKFPSRWRTLVDPISSGLAKKLMKKAKKTIKKAKEDDEKSKEDDEESEQKGERLKY
jgi:hypothetical protein